MQEIQKMQIWSQGKKDFLEEETAAHPSILAGKIPCTEESGGHSPWGQKELGTTKHTHIHIANGMTVGKYFLNVVKKKNNSVEEFNKMEIKK